MIFDPSFFSLSHMRFAVISNGLMWKKLRFTVGERELFLHLAHAFIKSIIIFFPRRVWPINLKPLISLLVHTLFCPLIKTVAFRSLRCIRDSRCVPLD